ncbi:MAG TPA: AAA family ATPase, partial [Labilithrix sp.]
ITILDCIEFADRFRCCDTACDLAFLSMDLAAHGRVDLAERLLARYARASDDYDLFGVIDFYESYRAYVRAKIATLHARSSEPAELRAKAEAEARRHYLLALACDRRALVPPAVVAVGGPIASGKSTVADTLADRLAAPVVDADRTRKAMLGVAHAAHLNVGAFDGPYDPRVTERVYDEMMRRADVILASGRPVVLDASFRTAALREKARAVAARHRVPFLFAECRAPERVLLERLAAREKTTSVSDGRRAIFADFLARSEPVTEVRGGEHLVIDTTRALDVVLAALAARVTAWPRGLVA